MNRFYFDTGVLYSNYPFLSKGQVERGGTKQIPFDADAPPKSRLLFCCDIPDLPESNRSDVIVREIFNTTMVSKYAYFVIPKEQ